MTPEERITALENQIQEMQATYRQAVDLMQFLGGSERIFQAATLTLVAAFPHKKEFRHLFEKISERTVTSALFDSQNEAHLEAVEAARTLVLQHLDNE